MNRPITKILIIRLSSIGDVLQCMSTVNGIKQKYPQATIHWVVRSDIAPILKIDSRITKIWAFEKKTGLKGLWKMAQSLHKEKFSHIYDAHSNIRSNIIKLRICPFWKRQLGISPLFTMRSKERIKRILLFRFRINRFPKPFKGMVSYQTPLKKWGITDFSIHTPFSWHFNKETQEKVHRLILSNDLKEAVCLVPSAAWDMKRWPISYWKELIQLMPEQKFVVIGGPQDYFCQDITDIAPERVTNLAGKTNLLDSCFVVHKTALTISGDTGFIHATDLFSRKGIFLAGPSAFGFPTGKQITILEKEMTCRPCTKDGRGKCSQKLYKQCLVSITPQEVVKTAQNLLK